MRPVYRSDRSILCRLRRTPFDLRWFLLPGTLYCCSSLAQSPASFPQQASLSEAMLPDAPAVQGSIAGAVVDVSGSVIPSAHVSLVQTCSSRRQDVTTTADGRFFIAAVPAGAYQITVSATGFATLSNTVLLHAGEALQLPDTSLAVGATVTEVQVSMTQQELAEKQIHVEEKQHVLGFIPNFYVSYDPEAVPLTSRQKFELAWKSSIDPFTFIGNGIGAGIEQAADSFSGYGQGAQGYAKRYGTGYADGFIGNMLGGAILPSLFKQDPRYFWKGTGSKKSRVLYAVERAVVTRGDNGKTQVDYSDLLGNLAAAGISNIYYPASDRNGAGLTFENFAIGIGGSAVGNLFQEFLVRKLTPHTHDPQPVKP